MRKRIGRQPLGDVLIVGRGPALVGAVGRQPRREAGQAAQAQQRLILALGSMGSFFFGKDWSRSVVKMTQLITLFSLTEAVCDQLFFFCTQCVEMRESAGDNSTDW